MIKSMIENAFFKNSILLVWLLCIPLLALHAEESPQTYLIFLKTVGSSHSGTDQRLTSLLAEAAELALQQQGFTVLTEGTWQKKQPATGNHPEINALPPDIYAQLTITAFYTEDIKNLTIAFEWQNKVKNSASYSTTAQLNDSLLYLDKFIGDALLEITSKLGIKLPAAREKSSTKASDQPSDESEKYNQYAKQQFKTPEDTTRQQDQGQLGGAENTTDTPGQINPDTLVTERSNGYIPKTCELALESAPFFPAGEATQLTQWGLLAAARASYLLHFGEQSELALGIYVALNYFTTTKTISPIPVIYLPMGLDLRYIIHSFLPFSFYMRLSGGPAVNLLFFSQTLAVTRLTAYMSGGIGLMYAFGSTFGLGIDSNFSCYFEPLQPVLGFHPAAVLFYRL